MYTFLIISMHGAWERMRKEAAVTYFNVGKISGFHGDEHENGSLLGWYALMMVVVGTYETSVSTYQSTRRNIPEGSYLNSRYYSAFVTRD
jgi:hypothetical protein